MAPPQPAADPVVARTEAFLRAQYPECVLIPTKSNDPTAPADKSKQPRWCHAGVATDWLWKEWERRGRANCAKGAVIILRAGLIVIDFDDVGMADVFVAGCPAMATTAIQETSKGRHYFFRRTSECDKAKLFDKARCMTLEDGDPMPVDIKTVTATGSGGAISVYPSPGKRWLRPLYECPPIDLPDALLAVILACHKDVGRRDQVPRAPVPAQYSADEPYPAASRDEVRALLMECVDAKRADNYDDWLRVGMALRNEHPSLLDVWDDFSRRCAAKYERDVDACDAKWTTFGRLPVACRRVTLGTVHAWAKADNPGRYAAITGRAPEAVLRWELPMPPPSPPREPIVDAVGAAAADDDVISLASASSSHLSASSSSEMTRALKLSTTYDWMARPTSDGNIKLTAPKCRECLVKPGVRHDEAGTDSVFIKPALRGNKRMCLICGCAGVMTHPSAQVVNAVFAMLQHMGVVERPPETLTEFETLRDHMLDVARQHRYMKVAAARRIYAPVPGCPCAYVPLEEDGEFGQFINHVFRDDALFHKTVKHYDELMAYLVKINPPHLPELKADRGLLSFANGVLVLREARFIPYADAEAVSGVQGRVARHHVHSPFTGSTDTPLLDAVLRTQFPDDDVVRVLYAMIGRLFFPIGELDTWQVMPFLIGTSCTGKSLLLDVVAALFKPAAVATLSSNHEQVFGLAGKVDAELIIGRDLPREMNAVLNQELFQCMVTGERVSIPRKHLDALDVEWRVPLLFASNWFPGWRDSSGQVSRRIVPFQFNTVVREPDGSLLARIKAQELPALAVKAVRAYLNAVRAHANVFWTWCPAPLRGAQQALAASGSVARQFLTLATLDDDERDTGLQFRYLKRADGWAVSVAAVKKAYDAFAMALPSEARVVKDAMDDAALTRAGFELQSGVNCCHACGHKRPPGGAERCCAAFAADKRQKKRAVVGTRLWGQLPSALHDMLA